jgi:hypothetical protein
MRHLFVELSYFTAGFLNQWMRAPDDAILETVYADWQGTLSHNPDTLAFYRKIKQTCPGTVFHGTDVGNQHDSPAWPRKPSNRAASTTAAETLSTAKTPWPPISSANLKPWAQAT